MTQPNPTHLAQAQALHQQNLVVDAHHDIALDVLRRRQAGERGVLSGPWAKILRGGGVDVQLLPIYVEPHFLPEQALRNILQQLEAVRSDLAEDDSGMRLATSLAEIDATVAEGKIAGVLALEGCDGLSGDPALLRLFYQLGVRLVSFTWNHRNEFADGVGEGESAGGLSQAGKVALKEMNDHRVICDVSHLAEAGFWDVARLCQGPFVASHSNARAICDHPRNLTDEQLRAIAASGGVVGLNFYGGFVDDTAPTAGRMVDHLAHIADTIGIDHVGLGTDFLEDWLLELFKRALSPVPVDPAIFEMWIPDCRRTDQLPRFTAELVARGFSEAEMAQVLGGNFMRVFRAVWS